MSLKALFFPILIASSAHAITRGVVPADTDPIRQVEVEVVEKTDHFECSATRIAPDIYLTAAHCFLEGKPTAIFIGSQRLAIVGAIHHPKYRTTQDSSSHDMAVFKTEHYSGDAKMVSLISLPAPGTTVMMAGFGDVTGHEKSTAGLHESEFKMDQPPYPATAEINGLVTNTEADGTQHSHLSGVCSGDSGGTGYIVVDGQVEQWGVDSQSDEDLPHMHHDCADVEWTARVDADRKWLDKVVKQLSPTTELVWLESAGT